MSLAAKLQVAHIDHAAARREIIGERLDTFLEDAASAGEEQRRIAEVSRLPSLQSLRLILIVRLNVDARLERKPNQPQKAALLPTAGWRSLRTNLLRRAGCALTSGELLRWCSARESPGRRARKSTSNAFMHSLPIISVAPRRTSWRRTSSRCDFSFPE